MLEGLQRWLRWRLNGLIRLKLQLEHPLEYLFLEVTRRCNLACRYCGSLCTTSEQRPEMGTAEWIEVVRSIARSYHPASVMVAITGGEPLLKDGIFDLFDELGRLGFRFGMVCNGTLLDTAAARRISESGMGSISLSLDAPLAVNDSVRGSGSFEGVRGAVQSLDTAGYRGILEIMSTVTRPVIPYLASMRDVVADLGVPRWRLVPVMPIGRAAQHPDLVVTADDLRVILEYCATARADGRIPRPEYGEEGYLGDRYEGVVRPFFHLCRAGLNVAGIMADGRVGACPELPESFLQGDLADDDFATIWETRYQIFRDRSWTRRGPCKTCEAWSRCRGGSLHLYSGPHQDFCRCSWLQLTDRGAAEPPAAEDR